jgi:radical SAM superfamily enzyme YgiQ (UPF0313 family)
MKVFLIYVRDKDYFRMLPEELGGNPTGEGRVKVMAFPPLGIETLAPVLRQHGHTVRMFDTCHPRMRNEHIAEALEQDRPNVVALSFLSTTTYPTTKALAECLKSRAPEIPIIVGGVFATMNADHILNDCPFIDAVGVGEGEELLPDYLDHLDDPGAVAGLVWREGERVMRPARSSVISTSFPIRIGPRCPSITSNRCRWTCPPYSRWKSSAPCRPPGVVRTAVSTATFPHSPMENGGIAPRNMSWARCNSSTTWATARSTSPTITSC